MGQKDERLRDAIKMIAEVRLYRPVTEHALEKRKIEYHFRFIDKGLDFINISGILRSESVCNKIPAYFIKREVAILGYRYNVAKDIFNYKDSLNEEMVQKFRQGLIS